MPNTKQAKKRHQQDEKRRIRNKSFRSAMRTAIKGVLRAETAEEAQQRLRVAVKHIDKAAKRHIIHANAAARYKSRLARRVASLAG